MTNREERLLRRLERALAVTGTHRVEDCIALAREGRMQFWEHDDALIATQLVNYPRLRAVQYVAVGGQLDAARALSPLIDAWALQQGAVRAEAIGRPGWDRVPHDGWQRAGGWWTKDLHHVPH